MDLQNQSVSRKVIRSMFNHGIPSFINQSDAVKCVMNEYQRAAAYTVLVPEPSDQTLKELLSIYKAMPTDLQYYGTILYVGYLVLGLGGGLDKHLDDLEKAWTLRSFDDKEAFYNLLKDKDNTFNFLFCASARVG